MESGPSRVMRAYIASRLRQSSKERRPGPVIAVDKMGTSVFGQDEYESAGRSAYASGHRFSRCMPFSGEWP